MNLFLKLIFGILILGGCATSASRGASLNNAFPVTNYTSTRIDEGTYRISFSGPSVTSDAHSADFARLRSAEIATKAGYQYFMINKYFVTPQAMASPGASATPDKNGQLSSQNLLTNILIIRFYKDRPPNAPAAVYDAAEVAKRIRALYGTKQD